MPWPAASVPASPRQSSSRGSRPPACDWPADGSGRRVHRRGDRRARPLGGITGRRPADTGDREGLVPFGLGQGPAGDGTRGGCPVGGDDRPFECHPVRVRGHDRSTVLGERRLDVWLGTPGKDPATESVATSIRRTVPSVPPVSSSCPSALQTIEFTHPADARMCRPIGAPLLASQSRTSPVPPPVTGREGERPRCVRPHDTLTCANSLAHPRSRYCAHEVGTSQAECRGFEIPSPAPPSPSVPAPHAACA